MRVSVCVGDYAKTPYCIITLGLRVYCMEELCYCLRENAFLLDLSVMNEDLIDWIGKECGLKELAKTLYPMVRKQGSLSAFVTQILETVGLYDAETISEVEKVLKAGSGLSGMEKCKRQIDYLVEQKKYSAAVHRYDDLLAQWVEEAGKGMEMPGNRVRADILHNKGVALTGMMEYKAAAECFREANEIEPDEVHYRAYLAANRIELNESEYLAFIAKQSGSYEQSLWLEKQVERMKEGFCEQEAAKKLKDLKEWRAGGGDKQRYYDELERIAQALKSCYRSNVSE